MRVGKLSAAKMAERRRVMLQTAFRIFSERNIESVSMGDVAAETDYNLRSFQRYFHTKENIVVETAAWAFESFTKENRNRRRDSSKTTAAEDYEFFLDSLLELYRNHANLLRFNQFFNVYVRAEHIGKTQMQPFTVIANALREQFRAVYKKGKYDSTLRNDIAEETIFSVTLYLMLAVVTRYAVGLAYDAGVDPLEELLLLKEMLLRQFAVL